MIHFDDWIVKCFQDKQIDIPIILCKLQPPKVHSSKKTFGSALF